MKTLLNKNLGSLNIKLMVSMFILFKNKLKKEIGNNVTDASSSSFSPNLTSQNRSLNLTPKIALNLASLSQRISLSLSTSRFSHPQSFALNQMLQRDSSKNSPSVAVMTSLRLPPFASFKVFMVSKFWIFFVFRVFSEIFVPPLNFHPLSLLILFSFYVQKI